VEEKLRTLVQQLRQRLRDFAYDYQALCLKWKPEISEKELVNRILNNINPRVAGCLRGTVNTVEQLVKVGSLVEKDCMGAKDYWQKVGTQGSRDKTKKSADRTNNKNLAGVTLAQPHPLTSLLIVPVKVNGQEVKAVLDTGSSYTLMQENLWKQLKKKSPSVITSTPQRFIMADGTIHQSRDLQKLHWAGLPERHWSCFGNSTRQVPAGSVTPSAQAHSLTAAKVNLYYALPPTGRLPELMSFTPEVPQWDSDNQDELLKLISAWPRTTSNILGKTSVVQHKITLTDNIPLKFRTYRVSPIKKQIIEQHVDQMLQDNIIEPSFSPWSSPVVLVPKPDGSYRFCVDYRKLNSKTVPNAYPMPLIHDILESLEGASWFSALDLQSGYWQVEMEELSREKTAFITTKGLFQFKSMPYGLRNSAVTFQCLMERVLADLRGKICFVYIDDIIIYSKTLEQHIQHLNKVFHKLTQANLTLNMKKCHFFKRQLKFLGHVVSERDASDVGLGAILTQHTVEGEKVVAYASRTLTGAERNYSASEKECLAVVWAVEKWRHYLEGSQFDVFTDHAALAWAFNCPKTSSRLTHWMLRLQQFSFQVHHRKGCLNMGPDALSRVYEPPSNTAAPCLSISSHHSTTLPHSLEEIAKAQRVDNTITHLQAGLQPRSVKEQPITFEEQQGVWYRKVPLKSKGEEYQLVVPHSLINDFLHYYHDNPLGGHLGQLKTLLKILEVAWWPSVRKYVWGYVKGCDICQKYKASNTKPSGFLQSSQITEPGHTLGMDLMGLFPTSKKQNTYLLVIVDYYTKWVEMFPLRDAKTQKIVNILREGYFYTLGGPKVPGFRQEVNNKLSPPSKLNQKNGCAINTAQQESTGKTPAELMQGRQVLGPLERLIHRPPSPDQAAYSLVERQNIMAEEVKSRMSEPSQTSTAT
ncbi:hypothetical protein M9458_058060, partial [Cirrhinus mrigala]